MHSKITLLWKYIQYLFQSRNQYYLHSPFIYKLVSEYIYSKNQPKHSSLIKSIRSKHSLDSSIITFTDLGFKKGEKSKSVKELSKASKNHKFANCLYNLVRFSNPKNVLELGTSLGISSLYILSGMNNGKFTSIDNSEEKIKIAQKGIEQFDFNTEIQLIPDSFDSALPEYLETIKTLDLAFIDGNHTYTATINYFKQLLPKVTNETIFIFDDIRYSAGMEKAWNEIKAHPDVTVTVDLFWMGIVFFRKEQAKQHFLIRY